MSNDFDLMSAFNEVIEKEKLGEEGETLTVDTGIDLFDYRNGKIEDDNLYTGVNVGKIFTAIGNSGTGKSTLLMQSGWNAVKDVPNAGMYIYDFENANNYARLQGIIGEPIDTIKKKVKVMSKGISVKKLYKFVRGLAKMKVENASKLEIDSGKKDKEGNPIYMLPPSIIVIDSWSAMYDDNIADINNEEFDESNMSGAQEAKRNKALLKGLISPMQQANISLYIIAQFSTKVETGPIKTAAKINYLGQGENIAGGTYCLYLADTLVKLSGSTKLEPDKDFGIKGFITKCKFIKSRSNEAGSEIELVFEQKTGFHNILTNFNFCKAQKLLKGSPRAYYFEGAEDYKFTQKTFVDTYNKHPEFAEFFDNMCHEMYMGFIHNPDLFDDAIDESMVEEVDNVDNDDIER